MNETWQELDVYWTAPSQEYRLYGLAQVARGLETTDRQLTLGLHVDYLPLSWGFARVGYRWTRSLEHTSAPEERAIAEVDYPKTRGKLRFRGRTRVEFRWIGGEPSQRIRQRVAVERDALTELLVGGSGDLAGIARLLTRLTDNHTARMQALGLQS